MSAPGAASALPRVLVGLMKGVLYREDDAPLWQALLDLTAQIRDYLGTIGLEFMLDEAEGYAYLRQAVNDDDASALPRLVSRRRLSYPVSLLLALLRKRLLEFDVGGADERLILNRMEIADLLRLFLPETANEARVLDRIDQHVDKVVELGFLRRLRGSDDLYEVRRVLKGFVDAQWLGEFGARIAEYRAHATDESDAAPEIES